MKGRSRIIVPVHNALRSARRCLESLRRFTEEPAVLEIVDDASEPPVASELAAWAAGNDAALVRQDHNLGFVASVNAAISRAVEPYVVVLNSDTTLTPGWLASLLEIFDRRPRAALVTPLSNEASFHSFPIPPGWSIFHLAEALRRLDDTEPPDLVTAAGFCMAFKRSVLAEVGVFDPAFGRGYGEESDLSMRLRAKGYEVLACPRAFVHHEGRQSFGPRAAPFVEHPNYALFMERWGPAYGRDLAEYRRLGALAALRARFPAPRSGDGARPLALLRRMLRERGARYVFTEGLSRGARLIRASARTRGLRATAREVMARVLPTRPPRPSSPIALPDRSAGLSRGPVLFLLEEIGRAGGVKLVLQLADALLLRGWDVRIAAPEDAPLARDVLASALLEPWFYKDKDELLRRAPRCERVIATLWSTAADAARLVEGGRADRALYFVQDREADFYRDAGLRERVRASYGLIADRVVTSRWLAGELESLGYPARAVIPAGVALDAFYPDPKKRGPRPRIAAMARPGLARRGYDRLIETLRTLREGYGERFEATVFGASEAARDLPWADVRGFVTGAELRGIYQAADIYFDSSRFQAFGLPVVEALACGAAVVAPREGGVAEVIEDGVSGVLVAGDEGEEAAEALGRLIEDAALREGLARAGRERAKALGVEAAAERWARLLRGGLFREGCL